MTNFLAKVHGTLGGSRTWSFGLHLTGGVTESALSATFNAAVIALFNTATDGLKNYMTSDVVATTTETITLGPTMKLVSHTFATVNVTGIASGASLPWNNAELVRLLSTTNNTKSARGSIYLPPVAESAVASHVLTPAFIASEKIVFETFFPAIHTSGVQSFSYNKRPRKDGTPAFTVTVLNTAELSNKPTTQRDRTKKVIPVYTPLAAF